jgi:beta-lactamase class A
MTMNCRSETALHELWHRWTQLALGYALAPADPPAADRLAGLIDKAVERLDAGADHEAFVGWAKERVPWLAVKLGDVPRPRPPAPPRWVPPPTAEAKAVAERVAKAVNIG